MKKVSLLTVLLLVILLSSVRAIEPERVSIAALAFVQQSFAESRLQTCQTLVDGNDDTVGYLYRFIPYGFLIASAADAISPVYAYSASGNFNLPRDAMNPIIKLIVDDLSLRIRSSAHYPEKLKAKIAKDWFRFLKGSMRDSIFEQWPPEGSTPTEGWLETKWTQNPPYNAMVPMDLVAGLRSYAGCPAIAMAQILNYHGEINETRFDTNDDYYHNFGAGYNFWIDDDHIAWDFPSYDTLNLWLDTLESTFIAGGELSNSLKAALCFACGVAAKQMYSSIVSGTYGMEQAIMAYQRFDFSEARLVYPDDTTLNSLIAENVKGALPVHLGLLSSTGSGGHNVVVDGYNTDQFYHFNFGWGGPANGWYTLPPTGIPYGLTIIESAVLDIKSSQYTSSPANGKPSLNVFLYPNPAKNILVVDGLSGTATLSIFNLLGKPVFKSVLTTPKTTIHTGNMPSGCFIYSITDCNGNTSTGKLLKE